MAGAAGTVAGEKPVSESRDHLRTVASLLPYLWPKGDVASHVRVVIAVVFLVLAKVANVMVPIAYARAVDALVPEGLPEGLPVALAGYAVGKWRKVVPGIAIAPVSGTARGRAGLHLLRLEPGVRLAGHGHGGMEMTVVLDGAIEDSHGTYSAGDVAENAEDAHHAPVAVGERACVCLVALEGKLRFHHWLVRMLQPLFGV